MRQIELTMLRTIDGSLDGRTVNTYAEGESYTLPDDGEKGLAAVFLREGWAREKQASVGGVVEAAVETVVETVTGRRRRGGR